MMKATSTVSISTIIKAILPVLALFFAHISSFAFAQEDEPWFTPEQVQMITVGIDENSLPPIWSLRGSRDLGGYTGELLRRFSQLEPYTFKFKALPRQAMAAALKSGKVDMIFPIDSNKNEHLSSINGKVTVSLPVVQYIAGLFVKKEWQGRDIADMKSIAVLADESPDAVLRSNNRGSAALVQKKSYKEMFGALKSGEVDGLYGRYDAIMSQVSDMGMSSNDVVFLEGANYVQGHYSAAVTSQKDLMREFDEYIYENQAFFMELKKDFGMMQR